MVIPMRTHIMTMKWKPCGEEANMRTSECSTQRLRFLTITRIVSVSETLESGTGTESGSGITGSESGDSESGNASESESGFGAKTSGSETA